MVGIVERLVPDELWELSTRRRRILRLAGHWPWANVLTSALDRLQGLPNPG
ncbi:hypothetical protein [Streptomyces sp. NPDC002758]